ncbi:MAG TPA: GNAT family N-acetyltransferase [Ilumatobacteraceae bacterium]
MNSSGLPTADRADGTFVLQVGHTAEFDADALLKARQLLEMVFEGELTDEDWEHSIGGMHAVVWRDESVIGHASVVQRHLIHQGRAMRTGYVEGVGVHPDCQRRGVGGQMMEALERIIKGAYDIGALGATDEATDLYEHRGWVKWLGSTSALTPAGVRRTPDEDGCIYVLPGCTRLDVSGELTCDWRDGDVW